MRVIAIDVCLFCAFGLIFFFLGNSEFFGGGFGIVVSEVVGSVIYLMFLVFFFSDLLGNLLFGYEILENTGHFVLEFF